MSIGTSSRYAERLFQAQQNLSPIPPITSEGAEITMETAYAIQLHNVERRLAAGDRVVGHKIGLTSKPMQAMLGVDEPDFGHLFASMQYQSGDTVDYPLIQPRVEPELAFLLQDDLIGPNVSVQDVLRATRYVLPAIEIIDSRIADWRIQLADTIADNASLGCFVLGDAVRAPEEVNLTTIGGVLRVNGAIVQTGAGGAVMGHPAAAVAWLANKLSSLGTELKAGEVILSGAISAAVTVQPGDRVSLSFGPLGKVDLMMKA
ncbi:2-keto-4-pentenoate hydratase [Alicyclobacillus fastidiosus]|uniref:2-keto-4-pentenoate hydratase n=1 Tax=Alicyclobacillus fastidiosus TaxID=392011 RepID=A0ABV5ADC1_9BACL|nr:2-keto-4-pentenoate hydratase [Alicyclobacillus fastidiosus]WEH11260.1 2-keto-4-pentenoate hydratase [Alicyclobacillus fastidiosus]